METNNAMETIDTVINEVLSALEYPQQVSSTGDTYDLSHLITKFGPLLSPQPEDSFVDLLESIIQESSASPVVSERPSVESNPVSPKRSFWSKLFSKKSHDGVSLPSVGSGNDSSASEAALKTAEVEVESLEASGPADLTCLSALSRELNRKICVWSSGMSLKHESGAERSGESLNVQFHSQPEDVMGHWSLLGDSDPQEAESGLNDCLFNAIAAQTGIRPSELREATVARMKTNIRSVARRIQEIARQEACDRIVLMVGGARYVGRGPEDAARILDNSQRGQSHPNRYPGHPRGHASNPGATGPLDSAENYSQNPDAANCDDAPEDDVGYDSDTQSASSTVPAGNRLPVPENPDVGYASAGSAENSPTEQGARFPTRKRLPDDDPRKYWKAGFLSIKEQDYFAHLVLSSPEAQEAMKKLNEGTGSELVRVKPAALPCEAPMGANFTNGFMGRPNPISELVIILKHHLNKKSDPNHDVFVFTFYPRLKKLFKKPRPRKDRLTRLAEREAAAAAAAAGNQEAEQGESSVQESQGSQVSGREERGGHSYSSRGSYDQRGRGSYDQRGRGSFEQRGRGSFDQRGRGSFDRGRGSFDRGRGSWRGYQGPDRGGYQGPPSQRDGYQGPPSQRGGYQGPPSQRGGYQGPPSQRGGYQGSDQRGSYQSQQNWQGSQGPGGQPLRVDSQEFVPRSHQGSQQSWRGSQQGPGQPLRPDSQEFVPRSHQGSQQSWRGSHGSGYDPRGRGYRGRGYQQ
ncbi:Protein of unknown function [Cotesia congregata]|uniref:Uncharacterized protein n=1 Tax=Cotesia congregata TaxID=51543 RepID=A0A8J2MJP8_COTCN|nr:Protein of unknown function [Cotesia congregata]